MQTGPLSQLSVLVTRPRQQSAAFCEALKRAGANAISLPTIEIVFPSSAGRQLAKSDHDLLIFTSANAVRGAMQHAPPPPWGQNPVKIAAIGPATALALQEAGAVVDILPAQHNSEGLLELLSKLDLSTSRVAILRGDSGRDLLFQHLKTRARGVDYIELYQRRLPVLESAHLHHSVRETNITTVGSDLGLTNLIKLLPTPQLDEVRRRPLIVNSQRCASLAADEGFVDHIGVASPPGDAGQLQALIRFATS